MDVNTANNVPTSTQVVNSLTEDTLRATDMPVESGRNKVAVFSNPFADDAEQILFISGHTVYWTGPTMADVVPVVGEAAQVVTVLHPRGVVHAFVLEPSAGSSVQLKAFYLDKDANGIVGWHLIPDMAKTGYDATYLSVQYSADRPSEAFVFVIDDMLPGAPSRLTAYGSSISAVAGGKPDAGDWWTEVYQAVELPLPNLGQLGPVCAIDGPVNQPIDLMVWALTPDQVVHEWTIDASGTQGRALAVKGGYAMAGPFVTPTGTGCVVLDDYERSWRANFLSRSVGAGDALIPVYLDFAASDVQLWQDHRGFAHLFGIADGQLRVVHQSGFDVDSDTGVWRPTFTTAQIPGAVAAISTPVAVDVVDYSVDLRPDQYPSQFVLQGDAVPVSERCAVYTQDVDNSWWSRESVRRLGYGDYGLVTRYKSKITVLDAAGGPVPGCPVLVSAPHPAEIEVLGTFHRVGHGQPPVALVTDLRGSVTVELVASSLAGAQLTLEARGMAGSLVVNPASDVHNFLAGTGTLPTQPAGISVDVLRNARKADGTWVFPAWHSPDGDAAAVPTPEQVLTWCGELLKAPAGLEGAAPGSSSRAWPGRRSAQAGPFWEEGSLRAGDLWEAIVTGAATVTRVDLEPDSRTATITVKGWSGAEHPVSVVWGDQVTAAHVAEAILCWIGAKVSDVVEWLTWRMDVAGAFLMKNAIVDGLTQFATYLETTAKTAFDEVPAGWFTAHAGDVKAAFEASMLSLRLASLDPLHGPVPHVTGRTQGLPEIVAKPQQQSDPHVEWFLEQLLQLPAAPNDDGGAPGGGAAVSAPPEFVDAIDALVALLDVLSSTDSGRALTDAMWKANVAFLDLFGDGDRSASHTLLSTALREYEGLIDTLCEFCDAARAMILDLLVTAARCIVAALALDFDAGSESIPNLLWSWLLSSAGLPIQSMTVGNFFGVMAALPASASYAAITGSAPFSSGTFPFLTPQGPSDSAPSETLEWLPAGTHFKQPTDYQVHPTDQLSMQLLSGLSLRDQSWTDQYLNAKAHGNELLTVPAVDYWLIGTSVIELFYRGLIDLPIFFGAGPVNAEASDQDKLLWGEYFAKVAGYLGDFVCAVIWPAFLHKPLGTSILGSKEGQPGNALICVLAAVSAGFRMAMSASDGTDGSTPTQYVTAALTSQLTASMPGLSALLRSGEDAGSPPVADAGAYAVKSFVDTGTEYAVGGWRTINAAGQRLAVATERPINGTLPDGRVGVPYDPDGKGVLSNPNTDWPPLGWSTSRELPPGLTGVVSGDLGEQFQLTGTPTQTGTFTFLVYAANSYQPNVVVKEVYRVVIS